MGSPRLESFLHPARKSKNEARHTASTVTSLLTFWLRVARCGPRPRANSHTIVFDQLLPVFLATSPFQEKAPISLPFRFADGIGMDPKDVGFILAVQGFWSMFTTLQVFPWVAQRVGPLLIYQVLAFFYVPVYFFVPYLLLLTGASRTWAIYIIVIWKSTIASLSYPANAIIITNTAPAENLGTINGVAASTASLCRAFGPTVSGALNAWGLAAGYAGVPWWTAAVAATLASILGLRIVDPKSRPRSKDDDDDLWEEVEVDERGNVIGVVGAVPATEADEALVRSATTVRALPNNDALLPLPPVPRPAMSAGPSSASLSGSSTRTERTSLLTS